MELEPKKQYEGIIIIVTLPESAVLTENSQSTVEVMNRNSMENTGISLTTFRMTGSKGKATVRRHP